MNDSQDYRKHKETKQQGCQQTPPYFMNGFFRFLASFSRFRNWEWS